MGRLPLGALLSLSIGSPNSSIVSTTENKCQEVFLIYIISNMFGGNREEGGGVGGRGWGLI